MSSNIDLEDALRRALKREEPSEGFARRVSERARRRQQQREQWKRGRPWMAIAAMLAAGAFVTTEVRDYEARQRATAQKAGHDLAIALRITGAKLETAHKLIQRRVNGV